MDNVEAIVAEVLRRLDTAPAAPAAPAKANGIPAEISARHVHLTAEDMRELFGQTDLPVSRMISQPEQYLSTVRVRLVGPKGCIDNVAVLGPLRGATQVELSATDARALGVAAPVRLSGDLKDAASIYLQAGEKMLRRNAAIVAKRHLHMLPSDAAGYGVKDGQSVCVRVLGSRPLVLEGVCVRVTEHSALALHIDADEGNAAGLGKDGRCEIVNRESTLSASGIGSTAVAAPAQPCAEHESSAACFDGKLLTEQTVRELVKQGVCELKLTKGQIVTPLARDAAKASGLKLTMEGSR